MDAPLASRREGRTLGAGVGICGGLSPSPPALPFSLFFSLSGFRPLNFVSRARTRASRALRTRRRAPPPRRASCTPDTRPRSRRTGRRHGEPRRAVRRATAMTRAAMSDGSRPAASASWSIRFDIDSKYSAGANECHTSAHRAAAGSPRFGPFAPIQNGGCGCCTGRGPHLRIVQRDVGAVVGDGLTRHEPRRDLERVVEKIEASTCVRELESERTVFGLEPGGAEREVEAAVRRVIDRHRLRREQRRVPVRDTGDEQSEPDARGRGGQCREGRHTFEAVARTLAVHGLEVVEAPGAGEPALFAEPGPGYQVIPVEALLGDVDTELHHGSQARFRGRWRAPTNSSSTSARCRCSAPVRRRT